MGDTTLTAGSVAEVLIIFVITLLTSMTVGHLIKKRQLRQKPEDVHTRRILTLLAKAVVWVLGFEFTLKYFGIELATLFAALGAGAITLGMSSRRMFENMLSGAVHRWSANISIGDQIILDGQRLIVEHLGIHSVRTRSPKGDTVIVPNSSITHSLVSNISRTNGAYRISVHLGVALDAPRIQVRQVLQDAADQIPWRDDNRPAKVLILDLGDQSIKYCVDVWITDSGSARQRCSDLREALWAALDDAGIPLAVPPIQIENK